MAERKQPKLYEPKEDEVTKKVRICSDEPVELGALVMAGYDLACEGRQVRRVEVVSGALLKQVDGSTPYQLRQPTFGEVRIHHAAGPS